MSEKETDSEKLMGCIMFLVMMLISPFTSIWRGYVLSILWAWFMTPLGVIPIGVANAIGLSVLVTLFTPTGGSSGKNVADVCTTAISYSLVAPALALGMGAIVHKFM